ncbi:MAG: hypothetical protein F6K40_32970 [Okeania sp. SIO3I5]|uniref:hypothetical protein n=1 Tax=Okeania sp. SIO3I5 TaxID=2607805 RepID=UPI0013BE5578|nr:hypothetical protein [Okeania sp. SIO3I5]NEQ40776.1 hypothetical protein [Okeania sp. SIO3I5]
MIASTKISGQYFEGKAYLIANGYDTFYFESCLGFDDQLDISWNASSPVYRNGKVFINNAFAWELLEVSISEFTLIELVTTRQANLQGFRRFRIHKICQFYER